MDIVCLFECKSAEKVRKKYASLKKTPLVDYTIFLVKLSANLLILTKNDAAYESIKNTF